MLVGWVESEMLATALNVGPSPILPGKARVRQPLRSNLGRIEVPPSVLLIILTAPLRAHSLESMIRGGLWIVRGRRRGYGGYHDPAGPRGRMQNRIFAWHLVLTLGLAGSSVLLLSWCLLKSIGML